MTWCNTKNRNISFEYPKKMLAKIFLSKKILKAKILHPLKKSFHHPCHLKSRVPGLGILSTCAWGERFGHSFPPPLHLCYNVVIITTVVVLTCINWIIVHVGVITGGKHQRKQQQCWSLWWKLDGAQSFVFCSLIVMALMRYVYYRAQKRLKF